MLLAIKISFILFFILLSIFLSYESYLNSTDKNIQSAPPIIKSSKEFLAISSGLATLYALYAGPYIDDVKKQFEEEKRKNAVLDSKLKDVLAREDKLIIEANQKQVDIAKSQEELAKVRSEKENILRESESNDNY